eukprot:GHUV01012440.1.p1 GENE.GHUV01012440.1~~GHUV01012440.1.p1  ORF type:complete len:351 (+),score=95.24 GHUV01012440.1:408-1460(+)
MTMSSETGTTAPSTIISEATAVKSDTLPGLQSPSKQQGQGHVQQRSGGAGDSKVLKLKGLPYTTSEAQVLEFFAGYNVNEVAFVYEPDGRPSGLAFAEFATREEALQALSKNGEYLGDRYVRLLHVPKQEMEEQVRLGTLAIPGAQAKMRQKMMRNSGPVDSMNPYAAGDPLMHGGMLSGAQQGLQDLGAAGGGFHGPLAHGLMPHSMAQGMQHPLPGMTLGMGPTGAMGAASMMHPTMVPGSMGMEQHIPGQMLNQQAGMPGAMPPHMALAYQLQGMGLSGQPRPSNSAVPSMMQMMPHAYAPAVTAAPAAPMAVIGTDSKTIKIRGLPFRYDLAALQHVDNDLAVCKQ